MIRPLLTALVVSFSFTLAANAAGRPTDAFGAFVSHVSAETGLTKKQIREEIIDVLRLDEKVSTADLARIGRGEKLDATIQESLVSLLAINPKFIARVGLGAAKLARIGDEAGVAFEAMKETSGELAPKPIYEDVAPDVFDARDAVYVFEEGSREGYVAKLLAGTRALISRGSLHYPGVRESLATYRENMARDWSDSELSLEIQRHVSIRSDETSYSVDVRAAYPARQAPSRRAFAQAVSKLAGFRADKANDSRDFLAFSNPLSKISIDRFEHDGYVSISVTVDPRADLEPLLALLAPKAVTLFHKVAPGRRISNEMRDLTIAVARKSSKAPLR
ncbi:MAG: hypothetical protein HY075_10970 [Deltaproteobacteria bacterium]|nr:hypothetical protein [Deltaproteobacteria bacterium]